MTGVDEGPASTMKRTISLRISVLARNLRNYFDRQVAALGVTRSQWAMIAVVATNPGATQRMIADTLEMSEASAGRLVDRLCNEGLLTRRSREDDRRAKAIYISEAAEPLLEKLTIIARDSEDRMFKGLSDTEIETLPTSAIAKPKAERRRRWHRLSLASELFNSGKPDQPALRTSLSVSEVVSLPSVTLSVLAGTVIILAR